MQKEIKKLEKEILKDENFDTIINNSLGPILTIGTIDTLQGTIQTINSVNE